MNEREKQLAFLKERITAVGAALAVLNGWVLRLSDDDSVPEEYRDALFEAYCTLCLEWQITRLSFFNYAAHH